MPGTVKFGVHADYDAPDAVEFDLDLLLPALEEWRASWKAGDNETAQVQQFRRVLNESIGPGISAKDWKTWLLPSLFLIAPIFDDELTLLIERTAESAWSS